MPVDLNEQLGAYGVWLERRSATTLVAPANDEPVHLLNDRDVAASAPWFRSRRVLAMAASLIVVVGLVGLFVAIPRASVTPSESPVDPPGALFLLPGDSDVVVSNGYLGEARPDDMAAGPASIVTLGRSDGSGFVDPISVGVTDAPTVSIEDGVERVAATGTAFVVPFGASFSVVTQQRGAQWLTTYTQNDRVEDAVAVLDDLEVDAGGVVTLRDTSDLTTIGSTTARGDSISYTTTYEVTISPSAGHTISVETATSPTSLWVTGVFIGARIERSTIRGTAGWLVTRDDGDEGVWTGLVWQATPNRVAAVSGHATIAEIRSIAEDLTAVDQATWVAALPDYEHLPTG